MSGSTPSSISSFGIKASETSLGESESEFQGRETKKNLKMGVNGIHWFSMCMLRTSPEN